MEGLVLSRDNLVITKVQFIHALLKCAEDKGCSQELLRKVSQELSSKLNLSEVKELKIDYNHTTMLHDLFENLGVSDLYLPQHLLAVPLRNEDVVVRIPWTDRCFLNSVSW